MQFPLLRLSLGLLSVFALSACGGGGATPVVFTEAPAPDMGDPGDPGDPGAPAPADLVLATLRMQLGGSASDYDGPDVRGIHVEIGREGDAVVLTPLLTSDDMGTEIEVHASSSPRVAAWFAELADGANDVIVWYVYRRVLGEIEGFGGVGASESLALTDKHPRLDRDDLSGAVVTRMVLRIDRLFIANGPNYYDLTYEATVTFHGELEPTAGAIGPIDTPDLGGFDR